MPSGIQRPRDQGTMLRSPEKLLLYALGLKFRRHFPYCGIG